MAYITEKEIKPYINLKLTSPTAFRELAELSREQKLKRGETGYSAEQMKNFTLRGHTCSPQVREMVLEYFRSKAGETAKRFKKFI